MSRITSVNILLDLRSYGKQNKGIDYVFDVIRRKLEQINGINLFFLEEEIVDDTTLQTIDVYISSEAVLPEAIRTNVNITKYAILNNLYACVYGRQYEWYEDQVASYQDNYDYFVVFSDKHKELYLKNTHGISPERVISYSLKYERDNSFNLDTNEKLLDNQHKYCLAFYKNDYYVEMERAAKGFIKFLEETNEENCNMVFVLSPLDDKDWSYKEISRLFEGHAENFLVKSATDEMTIHRLIFEADAYLDTFWLEDINVLLLEERNYGRYIVSNSLVAQDEKEGLVWANNSISGFKNAFDKLNNLLVSSPFEENRCKEISIGEKEQIIEALFRVENMKRETPLVTIITITYNLINAGRKDTVQQCLCSVHDQTYKNIEHIIIDGASNDGTLDLLEEYRKKGWIDIYSEKDEGLYDAMNKGIRRANGKYIAFLNSDDFYHDIYGVEKTVCALQKVNADYAFSDTNILNEDGSIYYWIADIGNMLYARNYCHQSMFTRLDVMKKLNGFDLAYRVSADSDLMIRIYAEGYSYIKVMYPFVTYRGGGLSATTAEESRRDHSYSFFLHLGDKYSLTNKDCYELWQYRFFEELPSNVQARLISKIPACFNAEAILNEYMRRNKNDGKVSLKRIIAQTFSFNSFWLSRRMRVRNGKNEMVYYLCKIIPIWITKEKI